MSSTTGSYKIAFSPDLSQFASFGKELILKLTPGTNSAENTLNLRFSRISAHGKVAMLGIASAANAATAGLVKFAQSGVNTFISAAATTKTMQRVIGGTTEQVSSLAGAMTLSGVSTDKTSIVLQTFSRNLAKYASTAKGAKTASTIFGTSITDASGKLKPTTTLLEDLSNKFKSMPDGAEKTALAVQLFGRDGASMLPLLNQGAAGMAAMEAKAKSLGLTLTDADENHLSQYKAAMRTMAASLTGAKIQLGAAIVPLFTNIENAISQGVVPAVKKMITWLQTPQIQKTISNLGEAIIGIGTTLGNLMIKYSPEIQWILSALANNSGLILKVALAIMVATKAAAAYNAIMKIVGITTKLAMGWQVALAVLAVGLLVKLINHLGGFKAVWNDITGFVSKIHGKITGFFKGAGSWLWNAGSKILEGLWNGMKSKWTSFAKWVSGIGSWIAEHKGPISVDARLLTPAGKAIMTGLQKGMTSQIPSLRSTLGTITDQITGLRVQGTVRGAYSGNSIVINQQVNKADSLSEIYQQTKRAATGYFKRGLVPEYK